MTDKRLYGERNETRLRAEIKAGLAECSHIQRCIFCRMYAPPEYQNAPPDDFIYSIDALAEHQMDDVVDRIPVLKLDWALVQIENTLKKKNNEGI